MEEGIIRFYANSIFLAGDPDRSVIQHILLVSAAMTGRYYPAFLSAIFAGTPAKEAVESLEHALRTDETA